MKKVVHPGGGKFSWPRKGGRPSDSAALCTEGEKKKKEAPILSSSARKKTAPLLKIGEELGGNTWRVVGGKTPPGLSASEAGQRPTSEKNPVRRSDGN